MANTVIKYHSLNCRNMESNVLGSIDNTVELSAMVTPFAVNGSPQIDRHDDEDYQIDPRPYPPPNDSGAKESGSTVFGAGFNFVNSIVGAGIIGMPIAIKESGFFMGIFLLVLVACSIDRSVIMMVECGIKNRETSLEGLCKHLFGKKGYVLATTFMFMYAYGAMVAYMLIIGDTVPVVMNYAFGDGSPSRELVVVLVAVFVILPLSLLRDMSSLAFTSLLSISADLIMIFFVIINAPITARKEDIQVTEKEYNFITYQIFEGIGTFSFAFVCQHNTFIVFESMKDPNLSNWTKVSHGSLAVAASMCLTLGLAGYLNFGDATEGDILNNFSEDDALMLGARLLLAITMVFTFPMECFVCRHALVSVMHSLTMPPPSSTSTTPAVTTSSTLQLPEPLKSVGTGDVSLESACDDIDGTTEEDDGDIMGKIGEVSTPIHVGLTLALWGSTVVIAVVFTDLRIVLALTGALAASMLGYILPALIFFKTFELEFRKVRLAFDSSSEYYQPRLDKRLSMCKRFLTPAFLLVFGGLALLVGVSTVLYDVSRPSGVE